MDLLDPRIPSGIVDEMLDHLTAEIEANKPK
jgi:hypothetical protein